MTGVNFLRNVFKQAPSKMILLVLAMILAGALEGIGITLFIPLIRVITSTSSAAVQPADQDIFFKVFNFLGIGNSLSALLFVVVVVAAAKNLFLYCQKIFTSKISVDFDMGLKKKISASVFASGWNFHLNQKVGTLVNAMGNASYRASLAFQLGIQLSAEILNVSLYCIIGLLISWQAFLMSMVAGAVYVQLSKGLINRSRGIGKKGVVVGNVTQSAVLENFMGIKFIKGNALEKQRKNELFDLIKKYGKIEFRCNKYAAILATLPEFFMIVIMCGILFVSHFYFHTPGGNLLVLLMVLYRCNRRAMELQTLRQRLVVYLPSYELCSEMIDHAQKLEERTGDKQFKGLQKNIMFNNITFSYGVNPVLKHVSFDIMKNQFIAFVGKSGSGKTTVLDLVVGLLKAEEGTITIDGERIEEYDISSWRKRVSYVPQEVFLLNRTVAENIMICNPGISIEEVIRAAKMAHADKFIQDLENGYDTIVGERGVKLSGGQSQRIVLARALAREPDLLILDEATSALDNRSEKMIQQAINELKGKITIIVVAHRLTTIQEADMIYVLDENEIVDSGTMQTLKDRSDAFKNIYLVS